MAVCFFFFLVTKGTCNQKIFGTSMWFGVTGIYFYIQIYVYTTLDLKQKHYYSTSRTKQSEMLYFLSSATFQSFIRFDFQHLMQDDSSWPFIPPNFESFCPITIKSSSDTVSWLAIWRGRLSADWLIEMPVYLGSSFVWRQCFHSEPNLPVLRPAFKLKCGRYALIKKR